MRLVICPAFFASLLCASSLTCAQSLEQSFVKEDRMNYNGYTVIRSFKRDGPFVESRTVVSRGKKALATITGCCYKESTRFALLPLLGNGRKQLIVEAYSGGGHCCTSYHIYDLAPRFHTVFNGDNYDADNVGYEMELIDINKDGVYEFVQHVMNFDYFYVSHAQSVFPEVVFAYDRRVGRFRPANRAFATYLLRDITNKERTVSMLNEDVSSLARVKYGRGSETTLDDLKFRGSYYHAVTDVVLTYIFAGKIESAWRYFDKNYKLRDKGQLRAGLRQKLAASAIHDSIYSK